MPKLFPFDQSHSSKSDAYQLAHVVSLRCIDIIKWSVFWARSKNFVLTYLRSKYIRNLNLGTQTLLLVHKLDKIT